MTKTTITTQSGTIRAYATEGVVTQSTIREYLLVKSDGGNKNIILNNVDNEYVITRVFGQGSSGNFILIYDGLEIINLTGVEKVNEYPDIIITTDSVINITDSAGDKKIVVQLKRIGLERILNV